MSRSKPAAVRYYFDADILGLAHVVTELRFDCTFPGDPGGVVHRRNRPACIVEATATKDDVWIPEVAARGWLIVTRDSQIQAHRALVNAVRNSGARMVALSGEDAVGTWAQLEILMIQWRRIEQLLDESGPFIYAATRTRLRRVALE